MSKKLPVCPKCRGAGKMKDWGFGKTTRFTLYCPACGNTTRRRPYREEARKEWER